MPFTPDTNPLPLVVFIVGPTGSGKSAAAAVLARRLSGEIISADSRLLYRGFDIGTDKPPPAARAAVPHHLIDVTDPDKPWSLVEYQSAARECILQIHARRRLPLCVGGTGQYVRALLEGWEIPPAVSSPDFRIRLEDRAAREGSAALYAELEQADPAAAARIDPRNVRRVVRALEVVLSTGKPFSALRRKGAVGFRPLVTGLSLPRPELYARVDARIDSMLAAGWIEEVRGLLARGYAPALPAFSALGYGQIVRHIHGELSLDDCVMEIRRATRRLIRHQANWFRPDDPNIHWLESGPDAAAKAEQIIRTSASAWNRNG
ncbi:MAG: tRNA (adenosine(37)-N6)-dimethylallyltransferase MiaA [Anaerolineales bacterium]|nr:tRNA (adenosine(37)-N6)-dimethylallyltransferase MiaA [Anaerolineales bacterium]